MSMDQRNKYKQEFNLEYEEYRNLHKNVEKVTQKFADLEVKMRQTQQGTEEFEVKLLPSMNNCTIDVLKMMFFVEDFFEASSFKALIFFIVYKLCLLEFYHKTCHSLKFDNIVFSIRIL